MALPVGVAVVSAMEICIIESLDRWLEFAIGTLTSYRELFSHILDSKLEFRSSTESFHGMILNATVIPCVDKDFDFRAV